MLREPKVEGWHTEWSREEIHPSERFFRGHGKRIHYMNSHYFDRNRDLRNAEGKTRENTYDRSSSHHSQITFGEGEKKGHLAKTFLIQKDGLIEDKGVIVDRKLRRVGLESEICKRYDKLGMHLSVPR